MQEKKLIIKGIYINYLSFFTNLGILFIVTPIIVKHLGSTVYGIWAVLGSVIGYLGLLNFGISGASGKYIAEFRAREDGESLSKLVSSLLMIMLGIGGLTIIICLCLSPFISILFNISSDLISIAQITFLIMGVNAALILVGSLFGSILFGLQRIDLWKSFVILQGITNALLSVILLHLGCGLIGMAIAATVSIVTILLLYGYHFYNQKYEFSFHPRFFSYNIIQQIAPFSIRTFILSLTSQIIHYTSNILISVFLNVALVTPYSLSNKLCFLSTYIFSLITETVSPTFTKYYTLNNFENLKLLYIRVVKVTTAIVIPIIIFFITCGHPFINLWVGKSNFVGMPIFIIFNLMLIPHALGTPAGLLLQAIGENKAFMYSEMVNAVLNLLLSTILVKYYGLMGIALGTLLAHACTSTWFIPFLACRHIKLSVTRYIMSGIFPPVLLGIPIGVITWFYIKNLVPDSSYLNIGITGFIIFTLYGIVFFFLGTTKHERRIYVDFLSIKFLKGKVNDT